jgi:hypothetical protein
MHHPFSFFPCFAAASSSSACWWWYYYYYFIIIILEFCYTFSSLAKE